MPYPRSNPTCSNTIHTILSLTIKFPVNEKEITHSFLIYSH